MLEINDTITGITTSRSLPRNTEVTGRIVGIDPKPKGHHRTGRMYYVVKIDGQDNYVYIQSDIKEKEE